MTKFSDRYMVDHPSATTRRRVVYDNEARFDEAALLVDEGATLMSVARRYDVSVSSLRRECRARGVWLSLPVEEGSVESLVLLIEMGGGVEFRICQDWQVTARTARRWIALLGEASQGGDSGRRLNIDTNEIARMWPDKALSVRDIADELGCSIHVIYDRARKMGLPRRHGRDWSDLVRQASHEGSIRSVAIKNNVSHRTLRQACYTATPAVYIRIPRQWVEEVIDAVHNHGWSAQDLRDEYEIDDLTAERFHAQAMNHEPPSK